MTDAATQAKLVHSAAATSKRWATICSIIIGSSWRKSGMTDKVLVGEVPFRWQTEFPFPVDGRLGAITRTAKTYERDLLVVIPGRDRSRAVIMADHYDTAYMEDVFGYAHGGQGPRLGRRRRRRQPLGHRRVDARGRIVSEARARPANWSCDVWLVHLTGEEFPSDCMGARHLCQKVVEGTLAYAPADGTSHDLSKTRVAKASMCSDMVAHNNDRDRDVFQICPGTQRQSMWLAYQAQQATETWNASVPLWNAQPERKGLARGHRSTDGTFPTIATHLQLSGEIRPPADPRSTLYNTDGQIFSDAGVPVVLFMENYDINRKGYHDTHDTLENIDLDYGAAVAAIVIESVARAATFRPEA